MKDKEVNSEYAVQLRRDDIAERYLNGEPTSSIWKYYKSTYGLSRDSLEKDITVIRNDLQYTDLYERLDEILIDQFTGVDAIINKCIQEDDRTGLMKAMKLKNDLIKMIVTITKPKSSGAVTNVQLNQNNINLPSMSVDEIKKILGKSE